MGDTYAQFLEITGAEETLARTILESCSYDLAAATEAYFSMMDTQSHSSPPASSSVSRQSSQVPNSPQNNAPNYLDRHNYTGNNSIEADNRSREPIETRIDRLLDHSPLTQRPIAPTLHSAFRATSSSTQSDRSVPETSSTMSKFSKLFSPPLDLLFIGTLDEGKAVALENRKWLLVNIQDKDSFASYALNRDVWQNETVREVIQQSYTLMQMDLVIDGDDFSYRGRSYLAAASYSTTRYNPHVNEILTRYKLKPVAGYPLILMIDPRTGELLWRHEGAIGTEEILSFLCNHVAVESLDSPDPIVPRRTRSKDLPPLRPDERPTLYRVPSIQERVSHVVIASYVSWYLGNEQSSPDEDRFWGKIHSPSTTDITEITDVQDVEVASRLWSQSSAAHPVPGTKRGRSEAVEDLTSPNDVDISFSSENPTKKARSVGEELRNIPWSGNFQSLEGNRGTEFIFRLLDESKHLTPEDVRLAGFGNINPTPESLGTVHTIVEDTDTAVPIVEEEEDVPMVASSSGMRDDSVELVFDSDFEEEEENGLGLLETDLSKSNQVIAISPESPPSDQPITADARSSSACAQSFGKTEPSLASSTNTVSPDNGGDVPSLDSLVHGKVLSSGERSTSAASPSLASTGQPQSAQEIRDSTSSSMFSEAALAPSGTKSTPIHPASGNSYSSLFDPAKAEEFCGILRSVVQSHLLDGKPKAVPTSTFIFVFPSGCSYSLTLPSQFSVRILYAFVGYVTNWSHQFMPQRRDPRLLDVWTKYLNVSGVDGVAVVSDIHKQPQVGQKRSRIDKDGSHESIDGTTSTKITPSSASMNGHQVSRYSLHLAGHPGTDLMLLATKNVSIFDAKLRKEVIRVRKP